MPNGTSPKPTPNAQPGVSRGELLDRAKSTINGDRAETYGNARTSFERIGRLWSALIGVEISATDVARMMVALKLSRLDRHDDHLDSWLDIAGYAALGAEIAEAQ